MDTGKHNNTTFYDGYEGECEIVLSMSDSNHEASLHIWDGYFEDIFGKPIVKKAGWTGFTKDYQESIRTFNGESCISSSVISEYLSDLKLYENQPFAYPETKDCLKEIINFFENARRFSTDITINIQ